MPRLTGKRSALENYKIQTHCDLHLDDSNSSFLHNTLFANDIPAYQGSTVQKIYVLDRQTFFEEFRNPVTLTLLTATQTVHKFSFIMTRQHASFVVVIALGGEGFTNAKCNSGSEVTQVLKEKYLTMPILIC